MIEIIAETLEDLSKELQKLIKNKKTKYVSNWWYLHGQLESDFHFDKGIMLDNDLLKYLEYTQDSGRIYKEYYLPDGIYDVKIIQSNKPCKGYFWTHFQEFGNIKGIVPVMHGLVCYSNDKKANEYAYKKYCEKSEII